MPHVLLVVDGSACSACGFRAPGAPSVVLVRSRGLRAPRSADLQALSFQAQHSITRAHASRSSDPSSSSLFMSVPERTCSRPQGACSCKSQTRRHSFLGLRTGARSCWGGASGARAGAERRARHLEARARGGLRPSTPAVVRREALAASTRKTRYLLRRLSWARRGVSSKGGGRGSRTRRICTCRQALDN